MKMRRMILTVYEAVFGFGLLARMLVSASVMKMSEQACVYMCMNAIHFCCHDVFDILMVVSVYECTHIFLHLYGKQCLQMQVACRRLH